MQPDIKTMSDRLVAADISVAVFMTERGVPGEEEIRLLHQQNRFGLVNVGTLRNRANHGTPGKKNQDRCDNWAGE